MPTGLYGELELNKSAGHTPLSAAQFLTSTIVAYISGNCINFLDSAAAKDDAIGQPSDGDGTSEDGSGKAAAAELRPVIAATQITAFALFRRDSIVAYAERDSTALKVVKWPSGALMGGGAGKMEAFKDLSTTSLAFSPDGQYLASMGSLPSFTLTIWDWRSNTVVCQASPGASAEFVTFDPLDSRRLCTSGGDGGIKFWRIETGWKRSRLRLVAGKSLPQSDNAPLAGVAAAPQVATHHAWTIDEQILCATTSGNEMVHYDPNSGDCRVFISAEEEADSPVTHGDGEAEDGSPAPPPSTFGPGQIACIAVAKEGLYIGGEDGVLRIFSFNKSSVTKVIPVEQGKRMVRLEFSPDHRSLLMQCAGGELFLHRVGSDRASELLHTPRLSLLAVHGPTSTLVTASEGHLSLYELDPDLQRTDKMRHIARIDVSGGSAHITCLATSPYAQVVVAGTSGGCVGMWDFSQRKLVLFHRVWNTSVDMLSFDSAGRYLAAVSSTDPRIALFDVFQKFRYLGHIHVAAPNTYAFEKISACAWTLDENAGLVYMFILASLSTNPSFIHRFAIPLDASSILSKSPEDGSWVDPSNGEQGAEGATSKSVEAPPGEIPRSVVPLLVYRIEDRLLDMTIVPSHLSAGRESFYVVSADGMLKAYEGPQAGTVAAVAASGGDAAGRPAPEVVVLGNPSYSSKEVDRPITGVHLHTATSWLTTFSSDGTLTFRTLLEPDKVLRVYAHDPFQGGVFDLAATANCRVVVSAGRDGLIRLWEWKYSTVGKRAAQEVGAVVDRLLEAGEGVLSVVGDHLAKLHSIQEPDPKAAPLLGTQGGAAPASASHSATAAAAAPEGFDPRDSVTSQPAAGLHARLAALRERLLRAISKNENLPQLERLDHEDFILDREERERLLVEAAGTVDGIRKSVEEEWLARRVIGNRIKQECWDSMSTIGQSILSFHADPLTGTRTTVTNYPIRRQSPSEIEHVQRVMMLRKVQMAVNVATAKKKPVKEAEIGDEGENSGDETEPSKPSAKTGDIVANAPVTDVSGLPSSDSASLLFSPFELTTNDRRRIQCVLLAHQVHLLKTAFNERFLEVAQLKRDEIGRIEERGERARGIMDDLGWTGSERIDIARPTLHDDEVPERVVEVRDDEIAVERFLGAEEQARLAEKQRLEAERARAAAVDNFRDRALTQMMNNSLADRSSEDEGFKAVVLQPGFMSTKPVGDWSDEERKIAKEYEKKLAVQKEEMEKARKALETELKKLLAGISELCDTFDATTLRSGLFKQKLATDTTIYTYELQLIKLNSALVYAEEDESKEAVINQALEECKAEKAMYASEIPELKKDLERIRDEHEAAVKRDKEVDRSFKKEFGAPGCEAWWEACWRLYRRSGAGEEEEGNKTAGVDLNPFTHHPATHPGHQGPAAHLRDSRPDSPGHGGMGPSVVANAQAPSGSTTQAPTLPPPLVALNPGVDAPEGLPAEIFQKLNDYINRKHQTATDVYVTYTSLHQQQTTITELIQHSTALAARTATLHAQLSEFQTFRFNQTYDLEICLGGLKQGQVEVVQSPVVTDYSGAVLVGREAVERLNEVICGLGKAKVDALNEMKEYRRGIHALEWETKTLDFSSETLLHKTRDIQLLRVTKHMQEYIRGGDERKQTAEIAALEKRGEYSIKAHLHNISEKRKGMDKIRRQVQEKRRENEHLDKKLAGLLEDVMERRKVRRSGGAGSDEESTALAPGAEPPLPHKSSGSPKAAQIALSSIHARRRLIDLARSQAQDIAILREEVERLRLRTYPAFPARRSEF
ncbi:hypothetical protein PhCBS80983_g00304 [Powellomyces hirtus]|uniref:Cilia- and flagella-associated protein 43 n=1 Tax=Powellomyces hirtus TaxID=109895 RepID=A0A507EFQ7_9FUNG|nr:hypothetical protein PhCBS80983_g00304 [Powellomyces hirtus]